MNNRKKLITKITISTVLIALGYVLPFVTGGIKEIGNMLCPMHIPVFLGGMILGPIYGGIIGAVIPLLRSAAVGMPPLFPTAIAMSFELFTYGLVSGVIFKLLFIKRKHKILIATYISLIISMLVGRAIWGLASLILNSIVHNSFTFKAFLTDAILKAWPGIIIQLYIIPLIIFALKKAGYFNLFMEDSSGTN